MKRLIFILIALIFICPIFAQTDAEPVTVVSVNIIDRKGDVPSDIKKNVDNELARAISSISGYEVCVQDPDCHKADKFLVVEISLMGETQLIISAKIINVESAKVENIYNNYAKTDIDELKKICNLVVTTLLCK